MKRIDGGFTLLEIMVALAIFSVAAITFSQVSRSYTAAIGRIESRSTALIIANNTVVDMTLARQLNPTQPNVTMAGKDWRISTRTTDNTPEHYARLSIEVTPTGKEATKNAKPAFALTAFVSKPTP